ncbi:MAG TPA: hypothetical protein PKJ33_03220 [Alphaproteobacteria bacterium]|nr:hypothetical protein [Alphaproteobacteria bacterium]
MSIIFIDFKFILSPIAWSKKIKDRNFSNGDFWFDNKDCKICDSINNENVKAICPLVKFISENYKSSNINVENNKGDGEEVPPSKHINFAIRSFVKKFQWVYPSATYGRTQKARDDWAMICWKCKNSRHMDYYKEK